ncbi:MAG: PQQ-dependent sugar dehydrogenase [Candidatus Aquicultorales bacterium]
MRCATRFKAAVAVVFFFIAGLPAGCAASKSANEAPMEKTGESARFPAFIELNVPVSAVFAPKNRMFITEKAGSIRVVENGRLRSVPYLRVDVPDLPESETGLLGLALHPDFSKQPYIYYFHTYESGGDLFNRVVRVRDDNGKAGRTDIIIEGIPGGLIHNGGVLGFGPDKKLYIMTGDSGRSELAQDVGSLAGKTLRIEPDGSVPDDNPFPGSPVYSLGHRNIFGMAFDPQTKRLYTTENGTNRDDEINIIRNGGNYGWPEVLGRSDNPAFINPIQTYPTQVAPTQAIFYTGRLFEDSRNDFFFGSFLDGNVHRLTLGGKNRDRVERDEIVYEDPESLGIVTLVQAPDGSIYVGTEEGLTRVDTLLR